MLLVGGLNRIRDLISSDIDYGQLGTGTTIATENDTALQTEVASTKLAVTKSTASKQINFTYTLVSTGGATNTYTEFELRKDATPVHFDRILFTGVLFTTNGTEDLSIIKRYFIKRG